MASSTLHESRPGWWSVLTPIPNTAKDIRGSVWRARAGPPCGLGADCRYSRDLYLSARDNDVTPLRFRFSSTLMPLNFSAISIVAGAGLDPLATYDYGA
eukprot:1325924-Pleurochrysis_carterae.AAC.2